jgi:hypothetical protein
MEASLRTDRVACGVGFVAAIMPEGIGSSKASAGTAVMPSCCRHYIFPQSGMVRSKRCNGTRICYNVVMAKQRKPVAKSAKARGFVVGRANFAKISAVEGIELTPVMEKRASEAGKQGLTAEEYRRMIVRGYRKG